MLTLLVMVILPICGLLIGLVMLNGAISRCKNLVRKFGQKIRLKNSVRKNLVEKSG
jgi:hypothetical protein